MKSLSIGSKFNLPIDAVTQTFAILAKRGVGKTYTSAVMAEEMLQANQQLVIADPIGVWWGLRAAADGKAEGLPIVVFGGDHGDVPLDAAAGELIADVIVSQRISAVLDLSHLRKGEQIRFMQDFCERLYHRNREPLHLILDEADAWAPQNPLPGTQRLLGAVEDLVRRGRARGIGVTLITQRAAVLNKNVLTQIEVLVALRMIAPHDRKAIDEWINVHGSIEQRKQLMDSLPSLPIGTAWFWSPGWLDVFQKVQVRLRKTFDSSATPKPGEKVRTPQRMAQVDLQQLRGQIEGLIEQKKADDPKELRLRIQELSKEIARLRAFRQPPVDTAAIELRGFIRGRQEGLDFAAHLLRDEFLPKLTSAPAKQFQDWQTLRQVVTPQHQHARPQRPQPVSPDSKLGRAERLILTALAQYPQGRSKVQVALLCQYSSTGGGFNNALSKLRTLELIEGTDPLRITQRGIDELGAYEPLPTGQALLTHWMRHPLLGKAERSILDSLHRTRAAMSKSDIAAHTNYAPDGGGFNNALSRLRTLELISGRDPISLAEELR